MVSTKFKPRGRSQSESLTQAQLRLGAVGYVRISSLKSDATVSRRHSKRELSQPTASIRTFGTVMPILVDADGTIVAGHARVEAARGLRLRTVPVLVSTGWTEVQIRAYRAADNRLAQLGEWSEAQLSMALSDLVDLDELPLEAFGRQAEDSDCITGGRAEPGSLQEAASLKARKAKRAPASRIGDVWWLGIYLWRLSSGELESPFGRRTMAAHRWSP
jgi:hypothetical protein